MISSRWHIDHAGKALIEERMQDVAPVLDANKRLFNDSDGYSPSREMRRVASIPLIVVEQWMKEGVDVFNPDHAKEVRRRLNMPEWRHLRTASGRV